VLTDALIEAARATKAGAGVADGSEWNEESDAIETELEDGRH
jgi:hypothetical protein